VFTKATSQVFVAPISQNKLFVRRQGKTISAAGDTISLNRKPSNMKRLLALSALTLTLAAAGCASSTESQQASPNASCYNLTGAALVECQKTITPAANVETQPFKMVKPPKGAGGMRGGMHQ
jgi:hypothetical protein